MGGLEPGGLVAEGFHSIALNTNQGKSTNDHQSKTPIVGKLGIALNRTKIQNM